MARYKDSSFSQSKFIPVVLSQQITPGTFEYAVSLLIEDHIDMSVFDQRYRNDDAGRPAYDPAMLLRVILSAYAREQGKSCMPRINRYADASTAARDHRR